MQPVRVGAVLYDPKVSTIWQIIRGFFEANGCPIDVSFFSTYELQVEAMLRDDIDVAWNSPLAWLDSQRRSGGKCRAIAMRDTDRDRVSHWVVRADGASEIEGLRGKTVATGAKDSPQAKLIPIGLLQRSGLEPGHDLTVRRFDRLVGKHGDHIGGEKEAFECMNAGEADACAMLDLNWLSWSADGTIDPNRFRILATTDRFDHCVFTVADSFSEARETEWLQTLYSMSYENPDHREMMDLEGLKTWLPGRISGFSALADATERQGFFE